ncbi:MAG: c-type cytochrome [Aliarcobacter sp.]|nr:c-type cytochrome [Aliarcobacter sp.]
MKKAILSTILLLGSTSLLADTTMCFKENHKSMSTIENTPLDGGICAGKYTVNDMKTKGWSVDDIKISQTANGMSFIYVLKTATAVSTTSSSNFVGNQAQMEANIIAKLEKKKEEEIKAKEIQEIKEAAIDGEKIYLSKCQNCHGTNGEKSAYNSSRPLKDLSVEDMNESIKDYKNGNVNAQNSILMAPYANYLDEKTIKGIHGYLNKINTK